MAKLIVILGPTGSGKSELAVQAAKELDGEIISADSRQVYKGLNIGTGKVKGKWVNGEYFYNNVKHHLIDFLDISKKYSVAEYKKTAEKTINDTSKTGLPILVGGTAQYIYAVVDNWQIPRVPEDKSFRQSLKSRIKEEGLNAIYSELIKKDPEASDFVQERNPRRVIRALEVINATRRKFSETRKKQPSQYNTTMAGIEFNREDLYKKIDQRVNQMIKAGLVEEVKGLLDKYPADSPGFQTIGYQEVIAYLNGHFTLNEAVEKIKFNSHRYVRHQNNWFRKDRRIYWIKNHQQIKSLVKLFLK